MSFTVRAAVGLTLLAAVGCAAPPPSEPVIVGHLAPRSGARRDFGEATRQGIALAVRGGSRRVEVHHVDGGEAVGDAAVRLISVTRAVALLGALDAGRAEAVARAAQPYGVPLVTPSPLAFPPPSNAFSTSLSPKARGERLADFADERGGKQAVVLIDERLPTVSAMGLAFVRHFTSHPDRRAEALSYDTDAALAERLASLAKWKTDFVLFAGGERDLAKVRAALPEPRPTLLLAEETNRPPDGAFALTTFAADALTAHGKEFAEEYHREFQEEPTAAAAAAYEGARLLREAIRRAPTTRPDALREALATIDAFESPTGPLTIDRDDHHARRAAFVVTGEKGETKVVKRYDPKNER